MQCFSVCVYCGSRRGAKPIYAQEASALGTGLAERGWRLVYGAGDVGLMGNVARAAQAAGDLATSAGSFFSTEIAYAIAETSSAVN